MILGTYSMHWVKMYMQKALLELNDRYSLVATVKKVLAGGYCALQRMHCSLINEIVSKGFFGCQENVRLASAKTMGIAWGRGRQST